MKYEEAVKIVQPNFNHLESSVREQAMLQKMWNAAFNVSVPSVFGIWVRQCVLPWATVIFSEPWEQCFSDSFFKHGTENIVHCEKWLNKTIVNIMPRAIQLFLEYLNTFYLYGII